MAEIKFPSLPVNFSYSPPGGDRIYHINHEDVWVVLRRLPEELWSRLRAVHFNDRSRGARCLGYVNRARREIALCVLPPRMSFRWFLVKGQTPEQFGAVRGKQWPLLAIRRFLLYDVFLHELGHLQLVHENRRSERLRFAREKFAEEFAMKWYKRLWSEPFAHPDPVHNPPTQQELANACG